MDAEQSNRDKPKNPKELADKRIKDFKEKEETKVKELVGDRIVYVKRTKSNKYILRDVMAKWADLKEEIIGDLKRWRKNNHRSCQQESDSFDLWYRGVFSYEEKYGFQPKAQRKHEKSTNIGEFELSIEHERVMFIEFERQSPGLHAADISKFWSTYFLMQHYGMPTRLLDWTEAFMVALYFAVTKPKSFKIYRVNPPAVIMLLPQVLNYFRADKLDPVVEEVPNSLYFTVDSTLKIGGKLKHAHEPGSNSLITAYEIRSKDPKDYPCFPSAIRPHYQASRIRAQRSVFTIHGQDDGFRKITQNNRNKCDDPPFLGILVLDLDDNSIRALKNQLAEMGISESTIFPDVAGLANELAEDFTEGRRANIPRWKSMSFNRQSRE
ncbi:MAG: FRG domain-containing protein [Desulfobacterales bacterium]